MVSQRSLKIRNAIIGLVVSIILILSFFVILNFFSVFSGNFEEATTVLGNLVQSSSALIAIVFGFILFVSEIIIGKYASGTLSYIFNNQIFMTIFVFYVAATLTITSSMWLISNTFFKVFVDVSVSLFLLQVLLLPILFVNQTRLLNPKTIIDNYLSKVSLKDKKSAKEATASISLVFSIVYKLMENREFDAVTYGLKTITNIVTSDSNKKSFGLTPWVIPSYERIAVEGFKFDPNTSGLVILEFYEIVNHLEKKEPFVLANTCSQITSACFNISSIVTGKPYSQNILIASYQVLQKIFVAKSLVDYGFSAYEELEKMIQIIKMMVETNVPQYLISGPELQSNCRKLIKAEKYELMQHLFTGTLDASPKTDVTLLGYASIILHDVPLNKKEMAEGLIKAIKTKFEGMQIQFEKTNDTSRTNIGVRNQVMEIKSGNEEIAKKVDWFVEKK